MTVVTLLVITLLAVGGCPPEEFDSAAPATLKDINHIRDDAALSVQEKRSRLEGLGLSPLTVNGILQGDRLGNQYGGDLRSAYGKVVGSRLNEMTPDEVQVYGDQASALDAADRLNVKLSDAEAHAVVTFFRDLNITSADKLKAYLEVPGSTVPSTIPDGVLQGLFVDFDPQRLLPTLR